MKKITEQAVKAFFNAQNYSNTNTKIIDGKFYLYDNCIAKKEKENLFISHAGYPTKTTKERLNGILSHLNLPLIYQKNYSWYWKDGEEFSNFWNKIEL